MDQQKFENLLRHYFRGNISAEEEQLLTEILTNNPSKTQLEDFDRIYQQEQRPISFSAGQKERIWKNIRKKRSTAKISRILPYAAACVLLLLTTTIVYLTRQQQDPIPQYTQERQHLDDQDSIYLRTPNQPVFVTLQQADKRTLLTEGQWAQYGLSLDSTRRLVFQQPIAEPSSSQEFTLSIRTQQGQIQPILMADGTEIWLNSQSEIDIASSFANNNRQVYIRGEAYFDVRPSKNHPFHVHTADHQVEVLGTEFNIMARGNKTKETTLIEGKVRVYNANESIFLHPGEQATGDRKLAKRPTDTELVTAWKTGDFYFDNLRVEELMDIINEWYDIKFVNYQFQTPARFSGAFKRTHSLQELLNSLEMVSLFRFELKDGGVYVLKK